MKEILEQYQKDGWIKSSKHPTLDLWTWNYTQKTQYDGHWDEVTTLCRGLITDADGNIIARGFKKFFNFEEGKLSPTPEELNNVKLFEKVDGSYLGVFWYNDQWIVNTKGSFITEQVKVAKEILATFKDFDNYFDKRLNHCFEVIYPQNRIVVKYNVTELVYLASVDLNGVKTYLKSLPEGMRAAKTYDFAFDYKTLKDMNVENEEGFVGTLPNGDMFKIKFENYIVLHGIVTHTSSYVIWEYLKTNQSFEFLIENTPDEFYAFVKKTKESILGNYASLEKEVDDEFGAIDESAFESDKIFAEYVFKNCKYPHLMFSLNKGSSIGKWLWDQVKPEYQIPFNEN